MKPDKKPHMNPRYTQISLYVIFTCAIIYLLIKMFDHGDDILQYAGKALTFLKVIFVPIVGGFAIAYILRPMVEFLKRRFSGISILQTRPKLTNTLATLATYLIVLAVLLAALLVLIVSITKEIRTVNFDDFGNLMTIVADNLNGIQDSLQKWIDKMPVGSEDLTAYLKKLASAVGSVSASAGTALVGFAASLTGFLTNLMFSVIFSIYFLLDGRNLENYWDGVLKTISSKHFYRVFHMVVDDTDKVFSSYIKGQLLDALILAFMVAVGLSIVGVPYGVVIGIVTGIGNLIPYVGAFVAYVCTIASCLLAGDIRMLIIATVMICIFQFIDGNIINPKLLSDSVEVHPLLVICCLLIGGAFGGVIGMVVSVPVGAVLKIQFERILNHIADKRGMSLPVDPPEDSAL